MTVTRGGGDGYGGEAGDGEEIRDGTRVGLQVKVIGGLGCREWV